MPGTIIDEADEETLRILISTDNHLGYKERDPIRGTDSFCAFEEVLFLAKKYKADMVLLAGDLFHDNKPSRYTLHKTMEILKRYTMGPDPVQIQILSKDNFPHGEANYLQEYYSVDLPIFSIHGNHDDPTRDGDEYLAALDLLSVTHLVNYFGRQDEVDKVDIAPVLIQKGDTKVALYGMGSLRDERLNRMWQAKKVRFQRSAGEGEWFNIFALHQNRDLGRGSKNCVHESMIPEWMDLIVWGHEHECRIEPAESVVGTFRIMQPGSSVATSLTNGESVRKHVGVLDIRGSQFRTTKIPLLQVRSFVMGDVSLSGRGLDPEDPKVDEKVAEFLAEEVKLLRLNAKEEYRELIKASEEEGNDRREQEDIEHKLEKPDQCLVRLKVEHSGFTTLNNQRFGARFVGMVANPTDILLFHRKKEYSSRGSKKKKKKKTDALDTPIAPEDTEEMNIEDLIKDNLDVEEKKLEIFDESRLNIALDDFVAKETVKAMVDATNKMLEKQQKKLITNQASAPQAEEEEAHADDVEVDDGEDDEEEEVEPPPKKKRATAKKPTKRKKAVETYDDDEEDDDDDDDVVEEEAPPSRARSSRTKRQSKAPVYAVDDDDDEDMEEVEPPVKKRATKAPAKSSRSRKKKTYDEEDEDEEYGASFGVDDNWGDVDTNPVR